jgi:hypothetical protein
VLHDVSTAIAVVTAQPGQAFQPLNAMRLRVLNVLKEKMFENTVKRIFDQDKVSRNAEDANQFTASVPEAVVRAVVTESYCRAFPRKSPKRSRSASAWQRWSRRR